MTESCLRLVIRVIRGLLLFKVVSGKDGECFQRQTMKSLVIGCGYLGCRVAERWLSDGHSVSALTRSAANAKQLGDAGITPIQGDVTDRSSLDALPEADLVLYAVGFDSSADKDRQSVVVDGLSNTLDALEHRAKRLVFISTTSVYGQSNGEWVDESSPTEPDTESARIALAAEKAVSSPSLHQIPQVAVLRLSGIYGPGRLLRRIDQLRSGEPMAGSGDAWLNLIHLDDAATAVTLAADRLINTETIDRETFLISDDRPVLRRDYYGTLAELTNSPPPRFDPSQSSRIQGTGKRCRNTFAKQEFGWSLRFPTWVEGLRDAV